MTTITGTIVKLLGQEEEQNVTSKQYDETETTQSNASKDGSVQFRLDADKLESLNRVAAQKRTGAGVLARMWVIERLEKETGGKGGIEPMELVADSMKALAGVLNVQNVTQQINERLDQLEKQLQQVNLPRLKPLKGSAKGAKSKAVAQKSAKASAKTAGKPAAAAKKTAKSSKSTK